MGGVITERPERRPTVLMLHGQPGGGADWDGVIARLRSEADPLAIDRPGWDGRGPARDLGGNALAALAALDARGVQSATIVGHSLGAAIAAWIAALYPDRVRALVLVAPAANLASLYPVDYWLAGSVAGEVAAVASLAGIGLALSLGALRRRIAVASGLRPSYLETARRTLLTPSSWRAYADEQRALVRDLPALEDQLAAITAPTTILIGAEDRIVPMRAALTLADQIAGARLTVCHGAGHLLPQRHPELVAEAILVALAAQSGSTLDGR